MWQILGCVGGNECALDEARDFYYFIVVVSVHLLLYVLCVCSLELLMFTQAHSHT